ncbi:PAS domain-containing protein [Halochromatium glycolicum]|uniref:PAS fold-4 domain-containing protein n=1 Tax=Halochromatium glycolicum TaxID=85075 RepID=A0AAJ0X9V5_9GAMM|nr:PAS domain-containing protein [Halochromatium glycolicum]MBK1705171.1 hypothetical protein [Halochromatium glycolicum]
MTEQADRPRCVHRINADGRISFVNDHWLAFASNNGYETSRTLVLGQALIDAISDEETQHIYAQLIERVCASGRAIRFGYRCDAPDRRRWMQMRMHRLPASEEIEFASELLHEEPRPPVALIHPPRPPSPPEDVLSMCSWCKAVLAEQSWVEIEQAVIKLRLFVADGMPRISHGICPDCKDRLLAGESTS